MKKVFLALFTVLFCLGLCSFGGCGSAPESRNEMGMKGKLEILPETKVLVAYFSWSGNTRAFAEKIQRHTGGNLFEIQPKEPYPTTYQECLKRAKGECADGVRPELAATADLGQYDVIFVGSPTWYGVLAPPVLTFLSNPALKGKAVVLFCTHGGGGSEGCLHQAEKVCQDTGAALSAYMGIPGGQVHGSDLVEKWLKRDFEVK